MKLKRGFTLIELLVVIAIIAILAVIIIVNLSNAKAKARDARRISDMKNLQSALMMYFDSNGSYPTSNNAWTRNCSGVIDTFEQYLAVLVTQGFISKIPQDPNHPNDSYPFCYYYRANYNPETNCGSPGLQGYVMMMGTEVEVTSLPQWLSGVPPAASRPCFFSK